MRPTKPCNPHVSQISVANPKPGLPYKVEELSPVRQQEERLSNFERGGLWSKTGRLPSISATSFINWMARSLKNAGAYIALAFVDWLARILKSVSAYLARTCINWLATILNRIWACVAHFLELTIRALRIAYATTCVIAIIAALFAFAPSMSSRIDSVSEGIPEGIRIAAGQEGYLRSSVLDPYRDIDNRAIVTRSGIAPSLPALPEYKSSSPRLTYGQPPRIRLRF